MSSFNLAWACSTVIVADMAISFHDAVILYKPTLDPKPCFFDPAPDFFNQALVFACRLRERVDSARILNLIYVLSNGSAIATHLVVAASIVKLLYLGILDVEFCHDLSFLIRSHIVQLFHLAVADVEDDGVGNLLFFVVEGKIIPLHTSRLQCKRPIQHLVLDALWNRLNLRLVHVQQQSNLLNEPW